MINDSTTAGTKSSFDSIDNKDNSTAVLSSSQRAKSSERTRNKSPRLPAHLRMGIIECYYNNLPPQLIGREEDLHRPSIDHSKDKIRVRKYGTNIKSIRNSRTPSPGKSSQKNDERNIERTEYYRSQSTGRLTSKKKIEKSTRGTWRDDGGGMKWDNGHERPRSRRHIWRNDDEIDTDRDRNQGKSSSRCDRYPRGTEADRGRSQEGPVSSSRCHDEAEVEPPKVLRSLSSVRDYRDEQDSSRGRYQESPIRRKGTLRRNHKCRKSRSISPEKKKRKEKVTSNFCHTSSLVHTSPEHNNTKKSLQDKNEESDICCIALRKNNQAKKVDRTTQENAFGRPKSSDFVQIRQEDLRGKLYRNNREKPYNMRKLSKELEDTLVSIHSDIISTRENSAPEVGCTLNLFKSSNLEKEKRERLNIIYDQLDFLEETVADAQKEIFTSKILQNFS